MSEVNLDQKEAIRIAKAAGSKIYRGRPVRLLLDLDDHEAEAQFSYMLKIMKQLDFVGVVKQRWWKSKGGGKHVLITLDRELPVGERLALQAILGSDVKKELYSIARLHQGVEEPSLLFRPPEGEKPTRNGPSFKIKRSRKMQRSLPLVEATITDDDIPF